MGNRLENKANFFALYWGKDVANIRLPHEEEYRGVIDSITMDHITHLELKPLSSISDEDAIEVAKILNKETRNNFRTRFIYEIIKKTDGVYVDVKADYSDIKSANPKQVYVGVIDISNFRWVYKGESNSQMVGVCIDYLRSRGYALPFMGLSVEELVNRGWVKLKGGVNDKLQS